MDIIHLFNPKCKKCGGKAHILSQYSPICRGEKTKETGIDNNNHYFGPIENDKCKCIIL